jgi:hypothetical protein
MTNTSRPPLQEPEDDDHQSLADSDASLARVTEDLIDILLTRGLIQFTDFPPAAQAKLLQRRQTREILSKRLKLLDDGDGLI